MAAHLGLPAAGLTDARLPGGRAPADPGAHQGVHAGGVRGDYSARVPGLILRAQDGAGDRDHFGEPPRNPAEDEPRGHSGRDSHLPL